MTVYNKIDKLTQPFEPTLFPNITISAKNEVDVEQLKQRIWSICLDNAEAFSVTVLPDEGDLLALYQQNTLITSVDFNEEKNYYELIGYRNKTKEDKEEEKY